MYKRSLVLLLNGLDIKDLVVRSGLFRYPLANPTPPIYMKANRWFLIVPSVGFSIVLTGVVTKTGHWIKTKLNEEEKKEVYGKKKPAKSEEDKQQDKLKRLDRRSFSDWE